MILSPHRDDAAFSCSLLLYRMLRAGARVTILNIFTISDYAPYLAADRSPRVAQVTNARAAEDQAFAARLLHDADASPDQLAWIDLDWQDAPLRRAVETEEVLTLRTRPNEVEQLSRQLAQLSPHGIVLAPMGLGGHTDHLLVQEAASLVFPADKLLFYEDLPYACRIPPAQRAVASSLFHMSTLSPQSAEGCAGLKARYVRCYPSQVAATVAEEIEAYARQHAYTEGIFATPSAIEHATLLCGARS